MVIWKNIPTIDELNRMSAKSLVEHLDIKFIDMTVDSLSATMPVDTRTMQPFGILHGGASAALAETLSSVATHLIIDINKNIGVGLEINANHIKTAHSGIVTGTVRPIHIGRRTHVWDIQIKNDVGGLVCISRCTIAIIDKR